ncbi:MAG: membrane dipeptidase [Gordonia sp. (in: high G+C Gram-positive bacteria)]
MWDQHCCLPLKPSASIAGVERYVGVERAFMSINVGYAPHDSHQSIAMLRNFKAQLDATDTHCYTGTVEDIDNANLRGQVAVAFDLEDSNPLDGDLRNVAVFYDLGVRTLLPTYNYQNRAGSGCMDSTDHGLTAYGRDLVREMNEVGMIVDATHCSERASFDLIECSRTPVIFSHTGMSAVRDNQRNISDAQARACAESGGVVGIFGIGIFIGDNDSSLETMVRHIDHAVSVVGPDHVGIGSDYSFDLDDINVELKQNANLFPEWMRKYDHVEMVAPEKYLKVGDSLRELGYSESDIEKITDGNFRRIATQVWRK